MRQDGKGRKVTMDINMEGHWLTITNIYAPNIQTKEVYKDIVNWVTKASNQYHLIEGDFNAVKSREDRKERSAIYNLGVKLKQMKELVAALQWIGIWKLYHPMDREFTYYSHLHDSLSRIDYFFGTQALLPLVSSPKTDEVVISDHAAIYLKYNILKKAGT